MEDIQRYWKDCVTVRLKTRSGDAPVLRLLWRNENGAWRITSYVIELP